MGERTLRRLLIIGASAVVCRALRVRASERKSLRERLGSLAVAA
jgi:hypothetical protein